jgi:D-alanyl-D-alanine carboxypeptidase/D-alanyl-D-alanine-endopeptidase (penicillin-binding protein 4)
MVIPGVSSSAEPYDAPNGALCVNFNTVHFKRINGAYASAEPQTPLLPMALKRVERSNLEEGRIVLSHDKNECTLYAGHLFAYFLRQAGCTVKGDVRMGSVDLKEDRLILRHLSPYPLEAIVSKILEHSNNFTTNQMLIAAGAKHYGSPGTLRKGVRAAQSYAREALNLTQTEITEGSGISRKNRMSADDLSRVLEAFYPYRHLMRHEGRTYYKTGTLAGISTRAGYIENAGGSGFRFAVMLNTRGKSTQRIMRRLLRGIDELSPADGQ